MKHSQVLVVPRDTHLDPLEQEQLRKAGIIVLHVHDPNEVRLLDPAFSLPSDAVLLAALKGLRKVGLNGGYETFLDGLIKAMEARQGEV